MEVVKQIFAILGTGIGVLSGLVTLYAKYLDMQKKRAGGDAVADPSAPAKAEPSRQRFEIADGPSLEPGPINRSHLRELDEPPVVEEVRSPTPTAAVRAMVRGPAIAMMIAGGVGFVFNLLVAGFGYVDEFVTPLTSETQARHAAIAAGGPAAVPDAESQRSTAVLGSVTLLGFAVASLASVWAGFNMLRLRSYWLSVAGSVAVMPGACMCMFAGVPVGIWSLVVLFRPGVANAFR
jgi:hypothetical protein